MRGKMGSLKHIRKGIKDRELSGKEDAYKKLKEMAQGKEKDSFDDQFTHNVIGLKQNTAERKERASHHKETKQNEKKVKHHKEKQCFKVKSSKKCGKLTGKNGQNCV